MINRKLIYPLAVVAALVVFAACQKDGATGPEGPQGPQGQQGQPGQQGPKGDTGVANVIYSDWLDVTFQALVTEDDDTLGYAASFDAAKLTHDILTKGEIKVYMNWGTATEPSISPIPYFDPIFGYLLTADYEEGVVFLSSNFDASSRTIEGNRLLQFRYVLIPGAVMAVKPPGVNLDNYSEAQQYLKINN